MEVDKLKRPVSTLLKGVRYSGMNHETSLQGTFLDGLSQLPLTQPEIFLLYLVGLSGLPGI